MLTTIPPTFDERPLKAVRVDRLQLPIHICLGRYEAATQEELDELITDLGHEQRRREAVGTA